MATSAPDIDPTTPTRTIYQEVAITLTVRKVAPLLELMVKLRRYQKTYYKCKDPQLKQELLIQAKTAESEMDKKLKQMGLPE